MKEEINKQLWDLFDMGKCYEFGYPPCSLDYEKALDCYMKCVKLLESVSDWEPTSVLLEKIGNFYYEGKGVKKDKNEAFKWYSRAIVFAKPTDDSLFIRLGEMYEKGEGTEVDIKRAAELYQGAVDRNGLDRESAQKHLLNLHKKGLMNDDNGYSRFKNDRSLMHRDNKYNALDVRTWIDSLKTVDPDSFAEEDPVDSMSYKEYRDQVFPTDLKKYFGDGRLGNISGEWLGRIRHYHLFTSTLFNHVLCSQVICNLYGKDQMKDFLSASGMHEQFAQKAALIHPVRLFCELGLIPHRNSITDFLPVFHEVSTEFNKELPAVLEKCSSDVTLMSPKLMDELEDQRAFYVKWIEEPDERCPKFYIKLSKRM